MKLIRLSAHAVEQCAERGMTTAEVEEAIRTGTREPVKKGRFLYDQAVGWTNTSRRPLLTARRLLRVGGPASKVDPSGAAPRPGHSPHSMNHRAAARS